MSSSLALPLLAALIAAVSLFTDVKTKSGKVSAVLLAVLLVLACAFQIKKNQEDESEKYERESRITGLIKTLENFQESADRALQEHSQSLANILERVRSFGNSDPNPTIEQIQTSLDANDYRTELASEESISSRSDVTVQYFPKDADGQIVRNALNELGFQVIDGNSQFPDKATNAIFHGSEVTENAIKLVAATLVRAGVQIKFIGPFFNSQGREKMIQVVARLDSIGKETLTLDEIRKTEIKRR